MNDWLYIIISSFLPAFPFIVLLFAFELYVPKENDK